MKNCLKCPDRAELHPEYKERDYKDTPCILCEIRERGGDGTAQYNDNIYYDDAVVFNDAPVWLDAWEELTPKQKDIARARMSKPNATKAELMRALSIPRMTFYREWRKIERVFGEFLSEKRST